MMTNSTGASTHIQDSFHTTSLDSIALLTKLQKEAEKQVYVIMILSRGFWVVNEEGTSESSPSSPKSGSKYVEVQSVVGNVFVGRKTTMGLIVLTSVMTGGKYYLYIAYHFHDYSTQLSQTDDIKWFYVLPSNSIMWGLREWEKGWRLHRCMWYHPTQK